MARRSSPPQLARAAYAFLIAATLVSSVLGGLLRGGAVAASSPLVLNAAVAHAALMMCGLLGTVIGIERAVALKQRWAHAVPLCTLAGSAFLLAGRHAPGAWAYAMAAAVFVAVNIAIVRRQAAAHTHLLLVAAGAWLAGNLLLVAGHAGIDTQAWWFAFLVITIAAERLEMTRLLRHRPATQALLLAILGLMLLGAALGTAAPVAGGVVFGGALVALAGWLALNDIARRTALAHGLSRYMAVCLLTGYAWLAVGGAAWAAMALGAPTRDAALHALGLGFVIAMVMGHAPAILPAVARVKLHYSRWYYLPLALLHLSLLVRLVPGHASPEWRSTGTLLNAAALAVFAATLATSAYAWHRRHGGGGTLLSRPRP